MDTQSTSIARRRFAFLASAIAVTAALASTPASAAKSRAGSLIVNTASATYDNAGTPVSIDSNTVTLKVDEVLDVTVTPRESGDATIGANSTDNVRSFTLSNAGNGAEAFKLSATGTVSGNQFDPTVTKIAIDTNGNGVYDPGVDQIVADGTATAEIDPDATVTVFVISSAGNVADGKRGDVQISAVAVTGSGPAGTAFAGQGTGGGDAITGATTAAGTAKSGFVIAKASLTLTKSSTVADPYGGTRIIPGSIITYRLTAQVQGSGSLAGIKLHDAIPAGAAYVPASLVLDGTVLTDAADSDAGVGNATAIDVSLGTVPSGATHTTEFKVRVN